MTLDPYAVPSPSYICDEKKLRENLETLSTVQKKADCKIILALKGFAMWSVFPIVREYLCGVAVSSVNEAKLGREEFGGEVHYYAPAIKDDEIETVIQLSDHIVLNSNSQLERYRDKIKSSNKKIKTGLRINPECSVVTTEIYNPCTRYSRLGITIAELNEIDLKNITGLHFHALCENSANELEVALSAVEKNFGHLIKKMEWINFGGGHHITREGYDIAKLISLIRGFKEKYGVDVILEPGEAIALNAGFLVASVLDIIRNEIDIAILDASASAHMPDVLEMPYRPEIVNAGEPAVNPHTYRLAGGTCLAGDIIGDYSFKNRLNIGDRLIFTDMLHYSMVKNNTFNGVNLPSIGIINADGSFTLTRTFGYEDYRNRLS